VQPVLIIAGPTAVGKSSLAVAVAETVGGEIVSADSRQVYRGLDIGTAKPSLADQERAPHHLVDVLDPGQPYSAGQFQRDARASIQEIQSRGLHVVVAGGSTLYVHGLVEGLADLPDVPADLVAELTMQAGTPAGRDALFAELDAADPEAASTLDPTKSQRLARLVGVLRVSGRPPSALWRERAVPPVPHHLVVLHRPRPVLYAAIDQRVNEMVTEGLEDEVFRLWETAPEAAPLLHATIGYQEILEARTSGHGRAWAVERIQRNSRRYAKRQLTWYRRYPAAQWLDAESHTPDAVLSAVAPWPQSPAAHADTR
jgi:tRNA dimethylallyltransferase